MKIMKKFLIILIIFIILLCFIIIYFKKFYTNDENIQNEEKQGIQFLELLEEEKKEICDNVNKKLKPVEDEKIYYTLREIMNTYYKIKEEKNVDSFYNVIDNKYIERNQITKETIQNSFYMERVVLKYTNPLNIYVKDINQDEDLYLLELSNYASDKIIYMGIHINHYSKIFSILPLEDNEYNQILISENISSLGELSENPYNKFDWIEPTDEMKATNLIQHFKYICQHDEDKAYERLSIETKQKYEIEPEKFKDKVFEKIKDISIKSFSKTDNDEYEVYSFIDEEENKFTFKKEGILDYVVTIEWNV